MSQKVTIFRYNFIIQKLRENPATFEEIAKYLAKVSDNSDFDFTISKRTFQRDLVDICDIFKIHIQFDNSSRKYCIDYEDQPGATDRQLEAFDIFNTLNGTERPSNCIYFDKRRHRGTENLHGLLHAIKNHFWISFMYHEFEDNSYSDKVIEPYALREFRNRWYILGKESGKSKIGRFSLDRLSNLVVTNKYFKTKTPFDVNDYYKYCFGIIGSDGLELQEVILSFDAWQGNYYKTLPFNETQEILVDTADEVRIKLMTYITFDLKIEILSLGDRVKVIKPVSLVEELVAYYRNALAKYS